MLLLLIDICIFFVAIKSDYVKIISFIFSLFNLNIRVLEIIMIFINVQSFLSPNLHHERTRFIYKTECLDRGRFGFGLGAVLQNSHCMVQYVYAHCSIYIIPNRCNIYWIVNMPQAHKTPPINYLIQLNVMIFE